MLIKSRHLFSSPIFKFKIYIHIASCVHDDLVQSLQNKQITWKITFGDVGTLPNVKITAWFVQNVLVLLMLIRLLVFLLHLFNWRSVFDCCRCLLPLFVCCIFCFYGFACSIYYCCCYAFVCFYALVSVTRRSRSDVRDWVTYLLTKR